ncbi:MAG: hypothetical protein HY748_16065 [Elusimicrobia bacterium]|nr:hypothetical protein [Elusimicrobiota bacterium]
MRSFPFLLLWVLAAPAPSAPAPETQAAVPSGSSHAAETVLVPDCCSFSCPQGWTVDQRSPKEDLYETTCRVPCAGSCAQAPTLSVQADMRRGRHGYETHLNAIRSTGERVYREAVFNGLKAFYVTRSYESAVYVPIRRGYIRLGYKAGPEGFDREAEQFLELQRSFAFQTLCAAGSAQGKSARILPEAAQWSPISVRSDPRTVPLTTSFRSQRHGESRAKALAAVYDVAYDCALIVSVFPEALRKDGAHFEFRYNMAGYRLDSAGVKLVTVDDPKRRDLVEDSRGLRRRGVSFSEESAGDGKLTLYKLEPWADPATDNRACLSDANFSGMGRVTVSYDATGASEGVE